MGAGPWTFYYNARKSLGLGSFNLATDAFKILLFTGSTNASDLTRVNVSELTGEVANGNGYVTGGQALANVVWIVGATADEFRFDADDSQWVATGAGIANIRYGVIVKSSNGLLLCVAELATAPVTATPGNPFVVATNVGGIFELN